MSVETLLNAARDYFERGGKSGPDRRYGEEELVMYEKEYARTFGALEHIYEQKGKMTALKRAAEFISHDTEQARSLVKQFAVAGDAGADAAMDFAYHRLKVKIPGHKARPQQSS